MCARLHDGIRLRKIVLVSTGEWWEKGNLDILQHKCREIAAKLSVEFAGALLRPHVFLLPESPDRAAEILEAARRAGYQLIREGRMSAGLLDTISQPLISQESLRERYNMKEGTTGRALR